MVTAMNLFVFALLGAGAMGGFLVFRMQRILRSGALVVIGLLGVLIGLRILLAVAVDPTYTKAEALTHMQKSTRDADSALRGSPSDEMHTNSSDHPDAHADTRHSRLEHVRGRGTLRVGYEERNLPFSFRNADGQLVGFDVEIAERLAGALEVEAEFVPINWNELPSMLEDGRIDIMPGIWYRPNWFGRMRLSQPYLRGTMGFATLDARRHDFDSVRTLRGSRGLSIGIPLDRRQVATAIEAYFGDAKVNYVTIDFWEPFFEGDYPQVDAFLMPAEHASAWTLMHPQYSVVIPQPNPVRVPSGFGMPLQANDLADFVDAWILFAESSGIVRREYDYWVLGQGAEKKKPRWSIMRDVLGWGVGH
jgi:ABC-type amino acid transport substrate-binding protein